MSAAKISSPAICLKCQRRVTALPCAGCWNRLRQLLSNLLKEQPSLDLEVAARISRLTGGDITKHQLDSWTAESREAWRFPLEYLPAFGRRGNHDVTAWIADLRGAAFGRPRRTGSATRPHRAHEDDLARQERALKKLLGEGE
ncbi:MAG: hypothetical protein M5R42_16855 [Rhodocyclaceae bacterium]|nr:hypothetical protein [Rhodocyclaceae bacterium]